MEEYDVVVVGAGPSGAISAEYAAKNGAKTLIVEEHASVGEPVQCAGLISTRAMEECEVFSSKFINKEIRGAFIHSSSECIKIDGGGTKAYVIERRIFDRVLVQNAIDRGADLLLKTKVSDLKREGSRVIIEAVSHGVSMRISSHVVIGADGVKSRIAKLTGLGNVKKILPCAQIEGMYELTDPKFVEIFIGSVAPGFFAWAIPVEDDIARIGLCSKEDPLSHLMKMLSSSSSYRGSVMDFVVGAIPLGPLKKTINDNVMIVGDAAGQVKPTSGGGIYTGAKCAKIAGEVAAKSVHEDDASVGRLKEYEKRWRSMIGRELSMGMLINSMIGRVRDNEFDELLQTLRDKKLIDVIERYGDMDYPSALIPKLLRTM
jgi:geranylgeranyl reductase family protein